MLNRKYAWRNKNFKFKAGHGTPLGLGGALPTLFILWAVVISMGVVSWIFEC